MWAYGAACGEQLIKQELHLSKDKVKSTTDGRKRKRVCKPCQAYRLFFHLFIDDHVIPILNHLFAVDELNEQFIAHILNYRSLCLSLVWVKQGAETADNAFQILKVYHSLSSVLAERDWIDAEVRVLCLILVFIDEVNHLLFASSIL